MISATWVQVGKYFLRITCNEMALPVITLNPVSENSLTPLFTAPHILRVAFHEKKLRVMIYLKH